MGRLGERSYDNDTGDGMYMRNRVHVRKDTVPDEHIYAIGLKVLRSKDINEDVGGAEVHRQTRVSSAFLQSIPINRSSIAVTLL